MEISKNMKDYIDKWLLEGHKAGSFDIVDDIRIIAQVIVYLVALGVGVPIAIWVARRIYKSAKKTHAVVRK